ncbi:putative prolyl 4-hydroxylase 4 [Diplogelasinospora grovesii]|uniref:Prolyl 4-hydroxylase 4 n=1 Tax=Diplogelasinospora grovesii TaxID=303347 RepID=A0AAN6N558_9PEZI|nr:putative prolyl 4-hydroxylase 4 [Diplogelasinospora grovesii]
MAKDKRTKTTTTTATPPAATAEQQPPPPSWPPFTKPTLPVVDLRLEPVVPEKVVVLRRFFPSSLCREYVSFLRGLPLQTTPGKPRRGMAVRVNDRYQIDDASFARRLWTETGLGEVVLLDGENSHLWGGEVIGLNPNIRVYRYTQGQFFDCHYDDSNNVSVLTESGSVVAAKTTWTLLLYLTSAAEGCVGGETVFYPERRFARSAPPKEEVAVTLETGMCLLHKHGDDCMLHEGREVTAGEKWVLRTDLCVRR